MKNILTPRQTEILQLTVLGYSDKQIAMKFGLIRPASVSRHILRARDRMSVKTRSELIAQAVVRNLVSVPKMEDKNDDVVTDVFQDLAALHGPARQKNGAEEDQP